MIRTPYFELDFSMAAYVVAWMTFVVCALAHLLLRRADYAAAYRGTQPSCWCAGRSSRS